MIKQKSKKEDGFKRARKITKKKAKSFYFASFFLGSRLRKSAYAIYAICRISDDAVDQSKKDKEAKLEKIKKDINLAYSGNNYNLAPLLLAFQESVNLHKIPKKYFTLLLQAMESDLEKKSYQNWPQLYSYCYKAAGVVGLIMLSLFGSKSEKAKKHAISLGIAMQMTNILRDIKEDYRRQRVYLPQDELKKFNLTSEEIKNETIDAQFVKLLKFQIERARNYYKKSEPGIKMISTLPCRLTTLLMKNIYAAILDDIEKNRYNVFSKRAKTSPLDKVYICLKTILSFQYL